MVISNKFNTKKAELNGINIEYFYTHDTNADKSLQAGVDAIKTFSKLFGDYPYKNFTIVECDFVYGGMEYPNLIMISNEIENYDDYLNVIIHETAHQWWYGMVGNDEFTYPWLDEALTEFSTILFYDNCEGYAFNHNQIVNISKDNYTLFISVYEDVLGPIDTSMRAVDKYSTEPEYTYCTYVKGVLMYDSLYQLIGKKDFYNALKIYFDENKFKNVTPENLISAFEKTSGQSLQNFFNSWINGKVVIR
jgi:aminopeptidase N